MQWMEQARLLLRKAHDDAVALAKLAPDRDIVEAIVGFHAQQAIEKGLKSVLAAHGVAYRRTHDLVELRNLLIDLGMAIPSDVVESIVYSPYAVELRYEDIPEAGLDRIEAVRLVHSVLGWCDMQVELAALSC